MWLQSQHSLSTDMVFSLLGQVLRFLRRQSSCAFTPPLSSAALPNSVHGEGDSPPEAESTAAIQDTDAAPVSSQAAIPAASICTDQPGTPHSLTGPRATTQTPALGDAGCPTHPV